MRYLLITIALVSPLFASAQNSMTSTDPFTLSYSPQYPAPNSSITLRALSASVDLVNATMDVSVGGKTLYQGSVRSIDVPLGSAGKVSNIRVSITSNGSSWSQNISVMPEDVVLVVEPRATIPPLYQGKPLEPLGGSSRIVAVTSFRDSSGKLFDPNKLVYSWKVDDAMRADISGIGKSAIIVSSPLQYRSRGVSVVVQSQDGIYASGASVSLTPNEPSIRIYENNPLLGIRFDKAISTSFDISGAETSLYAALYSFPIGAGAPNIKWYLNGGLAQNGTNITLRPTGSGSGEASLSLIATVGDIVKTMQSLSVSFGAAKSTNFFGL